MVFVKMMRAGCLGAFLPGAFAAWLAAAAEAPAPVRIPNGDFEQGAEGWSTGSPMAAIGRFDEAGDSTVLRIDDASDTDGSDVLSPEIPVPSAGLYELTGRVLPVSGTGLGLYVRAYDAAGREIRREAHVLGLGGESRTWEAFRNTLSLPSGTVTARIWVHSYNGSTVVAYLDDLSLAHDSRATEAAEEDMETIRERLLERVRAEGGVPSDEEVKGYCDIQGGDGRFTDIEYADDGRTRWHPAGHVSRILALARFLDANPDAGELGTAALGTVNRALEFWDTTKPRCPNWWYNTIGVPRTMYRALLLLEPALSKEHMAMGLAVVAEAKLGMTGQNLVWVAECTIARGCLERDAATIADAFRIIEKEIRITTSEGIQPDWSFYQHGAQLYSGGYGRGFGVDCPRFAVLARETAFAFPEETVDVLSGYILDGQQWMVRNARFDYSVCGREISRKGAGSAGGLASACEDLAMLETPRKQEFLAFKDRIEKGVGADTPAIEGNRWFWRSEYMAHQRQGYFASVRMWSPRVIPTETCNSENMLGLHLSDGVNYLYRSGDEYHLIFGVWDWKRLPGITSVLDGTEPRISSKRGTLPFVGGVSDGSVGVAAMDFERGDLKARKTWFFFDGEYVCLGSGIDYPARHAVITSVNQCLLRGDVCLVDEAGTVGAPLARGDHDASAARAVLHDGVAYLLAAPTRAVVRNDAQTNDWHRINHVYDDAPESKDVFSLWLEHGENPRGAAYAYRVIPGVEVAPGTRFSVPRAPTIVSNTPSCQAVASPDGTTVGLVFYVPGNCDVPGIGTLTCDSPATLLLRRDGESLLLSVADPTRKQETISVRLSGAFAGDGCRIEGGDTVVTVTLPGDAFAGSSVVLKLTPR